MSTYNPCGWTRRIPVLPNLISDDLAMESTSGASFEDTNMLPETDMIASPIRPSIEQEETESTVEDLADVR